MKNHRLLEGKKILFIGIGFYDYDDAIISELENIGATVNYICTCRYNLIYKIFNRLGFKKIAAKYSSYKRIIEINKSPSNNEFVFVIKGENLHEKELSLINSKNPNAKFILYLWDDFVRHKNKKVLLKYFPDIWSFDRIDCVNYNFKFRPLFYRTRTHESRPQYFLSFISGLHSDRLQIARNLKQYLDNNGKKYIIKLYLPYLSYLKERFLYHNIKPEDRDMIITTPLSYEKCQQISIESMYVVDIPYLSQNGLTIRSIETLANGTCLLTANKDIVNYLDIPAGMYIVIDRNKFDPSLIKGKCNNSNNIPDKYSLTSFLLEIFQVNN